MVDAGTFDDNGITQSYRSGHSMLFSPFHTKYIIPSLDQIHSSEALSSISPTVSTENDVTFTLDLTG